MPRRYPASEIAGEAGCPEDRVRWLNDIGLLTADDEGRFSFGDVLATKMIERDLDVFGQTVNLASRIADAAGPGEVLTSQAVAEAAGDGGFGFERLREVDLKGLPEPVPLYRATR